MGLNWDSFKWRNHQPDIGRFFNVDPLSEKYYYNSPYAFSENKVVAHIELEGLESIPFALSPQFVKSVNEKIDQGAKYASDQTAKTFGAILDGATTIAAILINQAHEVVTEGAHDGPARSLSPLDLKPITITEGWKFETREISGAGSMPMERGKELMNNTVSIITTAVSQGLKVFPTSNSIINNIASEVVSNAITAPIQKAVEIGVAQVQPNPPAPAPLPPPPDFKPPK